ncbi:uncharacterized protein LOC131249541 [Magnolia sinica]|uniref:uncharacterized protein LOC131249541 n=1 Tax=Magnolia sinica TaxID=86752 RepID=UPI00265AA8E0|nr:uncharacterized protein LOC131249541 [Magnolia sinica]
MGSSNYGAGKSDPRKTDMMSTPSTTASSKEAKISARAHPNDQHTLYMAILACGTPPLAMSSANPSMSGAPSIRVNRGVQDKDWQPVRHKHSKNAGWSLFVGNLAFTITEDHIRKRFGQCGEILDVYIPTFAASGRRKGHGFVRFRRKEEATSAKDMLHDRFLARRRMIVTDAIQRPVPHITSSSSLKPRSEEAPYIHEGTTPQARQQICREAMCVVPPVPNTRSYAEALLPPKPPTWTDSIIVSKRITDQGRAHLSYALVGEVPGPNDATKNLYDVIQSSTFSNT